jgi:hypothetical protein
MMPSAYTLQTLPKPNDASIGLRAEPARETAVLRFSGVARAQNYQDKVGDLRRWIAGRGLTAVGAPVLAQYDPPWTPWFMRHNEVLIDVAP